MNDPAGVVPATTGAVQKGLVHLSLWTVAIAQPLLALYGENLAVFTTARYQGSIIVWFALAVVLVPPAVVTVLDIGASSVLARVTPARRDLAHLALVWVGLWACAASVLHAVSLGAWPLDVAFTAALATAGLAGYARVRPVRAWLAWLSPLAPAALALFVVAASSLVWVPEGETVDASGTPGTPPPSIVWIQLDEAPLFPLVDSSGRINGARFPGFAKLAAVSTWYPNALTTSQRTAVAVPSMLSGLSPDYGKQPVAADHPRTVFSLVRGTMPLDVVEEVTALCPYDWCVEASAAEDAPTEPAPRARTGFGAFLRDAVIVLGHRLLPDTLADTLPPIDEGWGNFGADEGEDTVTVDDTSTDDNSSDEDTAAGESPSGATSPGERPGGHAGRVAAIEGMVARAAASSRPAFRFVHALLPHRPWLLAPDLRKSEKMGSDPRPASVVDRRRDNYQSLLNQYVAVDGVVGDMVDTLSSSPGWSQTMLIVTADHGITFVPGESYRDTVNLGNVETLDDIYRVPLFVKYPAQTEPRVDECAASTLDLFATIESVLGLGSGWVTDGVDLASACPATRERSITWLKGARSLVAGRTELAERVRWYGDWVDSDGDVDAIYRTGPAGGLVGSKVPVGAPVDDRFEWQLGNAGEFEVVGSGRFEPVPTRAVGTIRATSRVPDDLQVLVAVDDTIVGEVREASGLGAGAETHFSASLMSRLIGPGAHTVSLWTATPDGGSFVLRQIG